MQLPHSKGQTLASSHKSTSEAAEKNVQIVQEKQASVGGKRGIPVTMPSSKGTVISVAKILTNSF